MKDSLTLRELGGMGPNKDFILFFHTWRYNDTVSICIRLSFVNLILGDFKNTGAPLTSRATESDRFDDGFYFRQATNMQFMLL